MAAKHGIPVNRRSVILCDWMFIVGFLMLFNAINGFFYKEAVVGMLLLTALGTCIQLSTTINKTKRIY